MWQSDLIGFFNFDLFQNIYMFFRGRGPVWVHFYDIYIINARLISHILKIGLDQPFYFLDFCLCAKNKGLKWTITKDVFFIFYGIRCYFFCRRGYPFVEFPPIVGGNSVAVLLGEIQNCAVYILYICRWNGCLVRIDCLL